MNERLERLSDRVQELLHGGEHGDRNLTVSLEDLAELIAGARAANVYNPEMVVGLEGLEKLMSGDMEILEMPQVFTPIPPPPMACFKILEDEFGRLYDDRRMLGEIRAVLLANFGEGKHFPVPGLSSSEPSAMKLLMRVLEHLVKDIPPRRQTP